MQVHKDAHFRSSFEYIQRYKTIFICFLINVTAFQIFKHFEIFADTWFHYGLRE